MGSLQLLTTMVAESLIVEIACNSFSAHATAMKKHDMQRANHATGLAYFRLYCTYIHGHIDERRSSLRTSITDDQVSIAICTKCTFICTYCMTLHGFVL